MASLSQARRRTQQERSSLTRAALFRAAIELLVERGYVRTTVEDIAQRAGVSRGAVNHHFESRDDFWASALSAIMSQMDLELNFPPLGKLKLERRIDIVLEKYWSVFGGPLFVASLEIRHFGRLDAALGKKIRDAFQTTRRTRDEAWLQVFADIDLPQKHLLRIRRLMLDVLRGFALRRITEGPQSISQEDMALAKAMITSILLMKHSEK